VKAGSTVYIAGAGPVGRCCAASARLLGASCIILGDQNQRRLELIKSAGFEVVDLTEDVPLPDQIEGILGAREVDCGVDCVGFEAHGYGRDAAKESPEAVWNALVTVVRSGGGIGIPGVYTDNDPGGARPDAKKGVLHIEFGKAWIKSQHAMWGQCPVMRYNRYLMQAILWGRMDYLSKAVNVEMIPLDRAPEAYREHDEGAPKKFVIDPHNSTGLLPKATA
jgi:glutathione-independent formaldehyde dehydrogenase